MDSILLDENCARQFLDRRLQENDLKGAIKFAIKVQDRCPKLKSLLHFLGNIVVQVSTEDEETDWYTVLCVEPSADINTMKQHYVKLAKDNMLGSQEVHRLLNKAWDILSNKFTRGDYDLRRRSREMQQDAFVVKQASSATQLPQPAPVLHDVSTATPFIHPALAMHNVSGNNGRGLTTDTHLIQPRQGQYSVSGNRESGQKLVSSAAQSMSLVPGVYNLFGNREPGPMLVSSATQSVQPVPGMYSVSGNVGIGPRLVLSPAGLFQPELGMYNVSGYRESGPSLVSSAKPLIQPTPSMYNVCKNNESIPRSVLPCSKSFHLAPGLCSGSGNNGSGLAKVPSDAQLFQSAHVNLKRRYEGEDLPSTTRAKAWCTHHFTDEHKRILMQKTRNVIFEKLNERNAAAKDNNEHNPADITDVPRDDEMKTMEVPDSDFHDFDMERTMESFAENQVWAVYDEHGGMPRLYALIQKVLKKSSKLQVSWLNSESNMEPELLKWMDYGFPKTCGDFCVDEQERTSIIFNSFSHRVAGCTKAINVYRIFPKKGDVWALYMNWSPRWNDHTTEEEKRKYNMVEVLEDYKEDKGVTVVPLVKVSGFTAVFCQHSDAKEVRTLPKEEIFRFSHQVSSYLLTDQEAPNAPKGSRELDPAAMTPELLQVIH